MEIVEAGVILAAVALGVAIGKIMSNSKRTIDPKKFKEVDEMEKKLLNAKIGYIQKSLDALMRRVGPTELGEGEEEKAKGNELAEIWNGLPTPVRMALNTLAKAKLGMSVDELVNDSTKLDYLINELAPKILPTLAAKTVEKPPERPVIDVTKPLTPEQIDQLVKAWGAS